MRDNMIIDDWFCSQLEQVYEELQEITPEIRERVAGHIKVVYDLGPIGRSEGLLALEEAIGSMEDETVRDLVMLVVDGTDPERIMEIFKLGYASTKRSKTAVRKLMDLISYAGILLVQAGTNPRLIETTLCTLANMDIREELKRQTLRPLWSAGPNAEELAAIEQAENLVFSPRDGRQADGEAQGYVNLLMKHIRLMDTYTLDRLLQRTDHKDLRTAMYLWDSECRSRIFRRGTKRWAAQMSADFLHERYWQDMGDALAANRRLLRALEKIVSWGYGSYGSDILIYKDREFVFTEGETCDELKEELKKAVEALGEE